MATSATEVTPTDKRLDKIERRLARIEKQLEALAPTMKTNGRSSAGKKPKEELKGGATIAYVDSLVARKKAKGAKPAELAEYRAELMKRHGLTDPV
jgi:hypothetical protein